MKRKYFGIFPILAVFLSGCQANELENRCFPLLTVVDMAEHKDHVELCFFVPTPSDTKEGTESKEEEKTVTGESFEAAWEIYEQELSKYPDYNHMKVMILGRDLIENQDCYTSMLEVLQLKNEFPRNTYVCVVEDTEEFMEAKVLEKDPGTYLEEFLENQSKDGAFDLPTLGRLMDLKENQRGQEFLPYLVVSGDNIIWDGNYLKE